MKKKPISLQPYISRMQQRAQQALALPKSEQQEFYYCGGRNKRSSLRPWRQENPMLTLWR